MEECEIWQTRPETIARLLGSDRVPCGLTVDWNRKKKKDGSKE